MVGGKRRRRRHGVGGGGALAAHTAATSAAAPTSRRRQRRRIAGGRAAQLAQEAAAAAQASATAAANEGEDPAAIVRRLNDEVATRAAVGPPFPISSSTTTARRRVRNGPFLVVPNARARAAAAATRQRGGRRGRGPRTAPTTAPPARNRQRAAAAAAAARAQAAATDDVLMTGRRRRAGGGNATSTWRQQEEQRRQRQDLRLLQNMIEEGYPYTGRSADPIQMALAAMAGGMQMGAEQYENHARFMARMIAMGDDDEEDEDYVPTPRRSTAPRCSEAYLRQLPVSPFSSYQAAPFHKHKQTQSQEENDRAAAENSRSPSSTKKKEKEDDGKNAPEATAKQTVLLEAKRAIGARPSPVMTRSRAIRTRSAAAGAGATAALQAGVASTETASKRIGDVTVDAAAAPNAEVANSAAAVLASVKTVAGSVPATSQGTKDGDCDSKAACAICLGVFLGNDQVKTLPCFHYFHAEEIDEWLRSNNTCPICREQVDRNGACPCGRNCFREANGDLSRSRDSSSDGDEYYGGFFGPMFRFYEESESNSEPYNMDSDSSAGYSSVIVIE